MTTVFTINTYNDGKMNDDIYKFCMKSWNKLGLPVRIFDWLDEEVEYVIQKYKEIIMEYKK